MNRSTAKLLRRFANVGIGEHECKRAWYRLPAKAKAEARRKIAAALPLLGTKNPQEWSVVVAVGRVLMPERPMPRVARERLAEFDCRQRKALCREARLEAA